MKKVEFKLVLEKIEEETPNGETSTRYTLKWSYDPSKEGDRSYTLAQGKEVFYFRDKRKVNICPLRMDEFLYNLLTKERKSNKTSGIIDPIGWEGGWAYAPDEGDEIEEVQKAYKKTSEHFKTQVRNMTNMAKEGSFCLEVSGYASPSFDGSGVNKSKKSSRHNTELSRNRLMQCVSFLRNNFSLSDDHILYGESSVINHRTKRANFNANQCVMIKTVSR